MDSPKAQKQTVCPSARKGVAFYRQRYAEHREVRGLETPHPAGRKPRSCADAHYLAEIWPKRSFRERLKAEEHLKRLAAVTLHDFEVRPGNSAWKRAVREAQRPYPGTEGWLLSCSASEGGWGRWVGYSGVGYSYSLVESDTVGGWLQFRPSTYSGFIEHALQDVRRRGYIVPESASSWLSPLGQALAGGWGATHGMHHHWAGSGC